MQKKNMRKIRRHTTCIEKFPYLCAVGISWRTITADYTKRIATSFTKEGTGLYVSENPIITRRRKSGGSNPKNTLP